MNQKSTAKQLDVSADHLIVKEKTEVPEQTVTSALQVQEALQRRGIALVFADLIRHETYTRYLTTLFGHLHRDPPAGYARCTVSQLIAADKLVWQALLEEGVRPKRDEAGVLALDDKLLETLQSYRVSFSLLPLLSRAQTSSSGPRKPGKPSNSDTGGKGSSHAVQKPWIKNKGGKKGAKGKPRVPHHIFKLGGTASNPEGEPICFAYNSEGGCKSAAEGAKCSRGLHICAKCAKKPEQIQHDRQFDVAANVVATNGQADNFDGALAEEQEPCIFNSSTSVPTTETAEGPLDAMSASSVPEGNAQVPHQSQKPTAGTYSFDSCKLPNETNCKPFQFSAEQLACPIVIEIFCGSARVTASLKLLGLSRSYGVDHNLERAISSAKKLDLCKTADQEILFTWLSSPLVVGVFLAPPCGTCSLARFIKLRDPAGREISGPRPLRNFSSPEGLPGLTETERKRVSAANRLYELVAKVVQLADDLGLLVVVENPRSSLFWITRFWLLVSKRFQYTAHQACAYGGERPKWTVLAYNHKAFSSISLCCPGESPSHIHKPWGLVNTAEGRHFSTSEETAYPKKLAFAIAKTFADVLLSHGWVPPPEFFDPTLDSTLQTMRAVATTQPKAARIPPVVREHKQVILLRGRQQVFQACPISPVQRLKSSWELPQGIEAPVSCLPVGAQLLRCTPFRSKGDVLQNSEQSQLQPGIEEQAWGIPFGPNEFVAEAVNRGHPKSFTKLVPAILHTAILQNFQNDKLGDLPGMRSKWFGKWTTRAKELVQAEKELKAGLQPYAARILEPKRLTVWKEILEDIGYPDMAVVEELVQGTELVGQVPICGIFEKTFKAAEMTTQQLLDLGINAKRKQFYSCSSSGDPEVDEQVYSKTLEEVEMGWAAGPFSLEEVPEQAVLSKRFGLKQPGKVRLIDDLSGSLINQTVQAVESPKPQNVDFIGAMLLDVLQCNATDDDVVGRTYDLKSAYKQMAVAHTSLNFAYVVVFNPESRKPEIFQLLAAPFWGNSECLLFSACDTFCLVHWSQGAGIGMVTLFR
eukprot:s4862_g2.t1